MNICVLLFIIMISSQCALLSQSFSLKASKFASKRLPNPILLRRSLSKVDSNKAGNSETDKAGRSVESVITPRAVDYSAWYSDVIFAADMVDKSPVRGCMVIKPWGMGVWDLLRTDLDNRIRAIGASNAYFPLFIPQSFLSKEAEHVDGFAKECAVVTHHRLCVNPENNKELIPDPTAKLDEPLIVRPTSETVIWNMFSKWITSYRDLPMKINQWANVVRWEMRTRPFLRSSEFLWQEGHTAHATEACARNTVTEALNLYADVCEEMLAMPTIKGAKSPSERFAGANDTHTIEAMMQNGWALQSGTSHFLGQNFARAFDVYYQNASTARELVWATSWGVSTRLIGAMVMTHSDDKGLVLPPRVAPIQVVIIPITKGPQSGADHEVVVTKAEQLAATLRAVNVRVKVDTRYEMRPGAKYFEWERKGLPVRVDIGLRDLQKNSAVLCVRHTGVKTTVDVSNDADFAETVRKQLNIVHDELLALAKQRLKTRTLYVTNYEQMKTLLTAVGSTETVNAGFPVQTSACQHENNNSDEVGSENACAGADVDLQRPSFFLAPWKCSAMNEAAVKEDCKATIRCYPFEFNQQPPADGMKCFYSGQQATHIALFARAF